MSYENDYRADQSQALLNTVNVRRYDTAGLETDAAIAKGKREEVEGLEVGIKDIAEAQESLDILVREHGEKLDEAEDKVGDATQNVKDGIGQLQKASKEARSARKRTCCILVLLLIIIAVVVIIVVVMKK